MNLDMDLDIDSEEDVFPEEMLHSPLEGIADSVITDIMSRQVAPSTPLEHFHAFRSAIRWSEPFIQSLLAFQFFMLLLSLWVSRKDRSLTARVIFMIMIAIIVKSAEFLNDLGSTHWREFATQNYFDKRGIFVAIMLSGPLLIDSFIMLFRFLSEASHLLVQVKREEIKRKKKKNSQSPAATPTPKTEKSD